MSDDIINVSQVEGRTCRGCTLCCKLMQVPPLNKPKDQWCIHCEIGTGCRIYDERPAVCKSFLCGYVSSADIGPHWQPSNCKMVLFYEAQARRAVIFVDSGRPGAWRSEPFYSDIQAWARAAAANKGQVIIWTGETAIAILPDREVPLGPVRPDQLVITVENPPGRPVDVVVIDRDTRRIEKYGIDLDDDSFPR